MSEGRRGDVVVSIGEAGERSGVHLLDIHSDADHNRSVLTFGGRAGPLVDGLVACTRAAIEAIDLRTHEGTHPRLGAMDVVPFVPRDGAGMPEAVAAARSCAERIWAETGLPSFLYEQAASGRSLPEVRRRAFRDLDPDFGGPGPHPSAGAAVVGARATLVAYNVVLATADVGVARRIATAIRERDGGLPGVRALGLPLESRGVVQVSMNLIRPAVTNIGDAFDAVAALAASEGIEVLDSEIVGLTPRAALPSSTTHLQLQRPAKILEEELNRFDWPP